MQRRTYLAGAVVGVVPFSGCAGLIGPDPEITDSDADQSLAGALTGYGEIEIALVNEGQSGDVEIEIVFEDGDGTVVGRESHVITMGEGERRRETLTVEYPDSTEQYRVEADAA